MIYLSVALGWACGLYVLFRNERSLSFADREHYGDSCADFEHVLGSSVSRTLLFLVEVTISGASFWECASQSEYHEPGLLLTALFLIIVIIMLLNTLIAMMAQTFAAVASDAFSNYAFAFAKTLAYFRNSSGIIPVPLNLLAIPFYFLMSVYWMLWVAPRELFSLHRRMAHAAQSRAHSPTITQTSSQTGTGVTSAEAWSPKFAPSSPSFNGAHYPTRFNC